MTHPISAPGDSLPNIGDTNWGGTLNAYITAVETDVVNEVTNRNAAIAAHAGSATDPHLDRAYASGYANTAVNNHAAGNSPTGSALAAPFTGDPHGDRAHSDAALGRHILNEDPVTAASVDPHNLHAYITTLSGAASGLATLDSTSKIPVAQLPLRQVTGLWNVGGSTPINIAGSATNAAFGPGVTLNLPPSPNGGVFRVCGNVQASQGGTAPDWGAGWLVQQSISGGALTTLQNQASYSWVTTLNANANSTTVFTMEYAYSANATQLVLTPNITNASASPLTIPADSRTSYSMTAVAS